MPDAQRKLSEPQKAVQPTGEKPRRPRESNKMTFKERKEFEALTEEIDALNAEKSELEAIFNSGEVVNDIAEKSTRYEEVKALLDEKELRWLELSEKD